MFDITSWVRETIFRRPPIGPVAGEELSEKQTTKLGYFLLICMFSAILSTAQWSLSIIQDIPDRPTETPSCVDRMLSFFDRENSSYRSYEYNSNSYDYGYGDGYNACNLQSLSNPRYDLTTAYNALLPQYREATTLAQSLSNLESEKSRLDSEKYNTQSNYNTALTEDIANRNNRVYDATTVASNLQDIEKKKQNIDSQIASTNASIDDIRSAVSSQVSTLRSETESAKSAYQRSYLWYRMIIALLSLLFTGIVFFLLYRLYMRYKLANSPHTVIFSVATFAYGLVLLQVLVFFLWDIIPHKFLELFLGWISIFTPLLFLVQFLWPVLIIAIFGYLVYRIQKRLYSPQNIIKRFVTDKKCPNCGNAVDMTKPFCPLCAHEIHIHCPLCHELTMKGMPYCSSCGGAFPKEGSLYHSHSHTLSENLEKNLDTISLD
jgi:rRNA maturation protein Nop10